MKLLFIVPITDLVLFNFIITSEFTWDYEIFECERNSLSNELVTNTFPSDRAKPEEFMNKTLCIKSIFSAQVDRSA